MGGVDQLDQSVAAFSTRIKQRKWWWPIFIYFFDVTKPMDAMEEEKREQKRSTQEFKTTI